MQATKVDTHRLGLDSELGIHVERLVDRVVGLVTTEQDKIISVT